MEKWYVQGHTLGGAAYRGDLCDSRNTWSTQSNCLGDLKLVFK